VEKKEFTAKANKAKKEGMGRAHSRGKTFGIPRRSVSKIAEADSTGVFPRLCALPQGIGQIISGISLAFREQRSFNQILTIYS
jgi:hypothetical protein